MVEYQLKGKISRVFKRGVAAQASSPACTELESLVMDWLGQMIGLPPEFLHRSPLIFSLSNKKNVPK
jgi:hypothetical protein